MSTRKARLFTTLWLGGWGFLWAVVSYMMMDKGWYLMGHWWVWTGIFLTLGGVCVWLFAAQVLLMAAWVAMGRISPRLARRNVRNIVANTLMLVRGGGWNL